MTDDPTQMLTDCLDGEPVDPDLLACYLESQEARDLACELLLLRAAARWDDERPSEAFYARMDAQFGGTKERAARVPRGRAWIRRLRPLAVAASIALAALGGFALRAALDDGGRQAHVAASHENQEPAPFPEAGTKTRSVPEPSRVVHFERGVDWEG